MIAENYESSQKDGHAREFDSIIANIRSYFKDNQCLIKDELINFLNFVGFISIIQSPDDCESLFSYFQELESKFISQDEPPQSISLTACLEAFDELMNPEKLNNTKRESILNVYLPTCDCDGSDENQEDSDSSNLIEIATRCRELLKIIYSSEYDYFITPEKREFKISDIAAILPNFPNLKISCSELEFFLKKLCNKDIEEINYSTFEKTDSFIKNKFKQRLSKRNQSLLETEDAAPINFNDSQHQVNYFESNNEDLCGQFKYVFDMFEEKFSIMNSIFERVHSHLMVSDDISKFFSFIIKKQIMHDLKKLTNSDFGPLEDQQSVLEMISNNFNTLVGKLVDLENFSTEQFKQVKELKRQANELNNCFSNVELAGKNICTELICINKQISELEKRADIESSKEDIINKVYQDLNLALVENNSLMIQLSQAKDKIKTIRSEFKIKQEDLEALQSSKDNLSKDYDLKITSLNQEILKLKESLQKTNKDNVSLTKKLETTSSKKNIITRTTPSSNSNTSNIQSNMYQGKVSLSSNFKNKEMKITQGKKLVGAELKVNDLKITRLQLLHKETITLDNQEEEMADGETHVLSASNLQDKYSQLSDDYDELKLDHIIAIESKARLEVECSSLREKLNQALSMFKELNYKYESIQDSMYSLETKNYKLSQDYQNLCVRKFEVNEKPEISISLDEIIPLSNRENFKLEETFENCKWSNLQVETFYFFNDQIRKKNLELQMVCSFFELFSSKVIKMVFDQYHLEFSIFRKYKPQFSPTYLTISKQIYLEFLNQPFFKPKTSYFKAIHSVVSNDISSKGIRNKSLNYGITIPFPRKSITSNKRCSILFVNEIHYRLMTREGPILKAQVDEQKDLKKIDEYSEMKLESQLPKTVLKKKVSFVPDSPKKEDDPESISEKRKSLNKANYEPSHYESFTISNACSEYAINNDFLGLCQQAFIINFLNSCNDSSNSNMYSSNINIYSDDSFKKVLGKILITKEYIYILNHETNYINTFFEFKSIDQISISSINLNLIAFHFYGGLQDLVFEDCHRTSLLEYLGKELKYIRSNKQVRISVLRSIRAILGGKVIKLDTTSDKIIKSVNYEGAIKIGYLQQESKGFFGNLAYVERFACLTEIGLFLYDDPSMLPTCFIRLENSTVEILSKKMSKELNVDYTADARKNSFESVVTKAHTMNTSIEELEGNYINKSNPYRIVILISFSDSRPSLQLRAPNKVEADTWVSEFQRFTLSIDKRVQRSILSCEMMKLI